jgi:starch-binding outer membrane protein, SusD/RagB family
MKKLIIISILLIFVSCLNEDILDKEETGDLTEDIVYADIKLADEVLNDLYHNVRAAHQTDINKAGAFAAGAYLDCGTVYGQAGLTWSSAIRFNNGNWDASNCWFNVGISLIDGRIYPVNYESIRAAHLFLENIEKVPFDEEYGYSAFQQKQKIGEAQFLLAWYYHELMSFYGGVTLIRSSLTTDSEEIRAPRNTYDECVKYVTDLCDQAAEKLPYNWPSNELGRATKGAALALKAKVLLYAASPLFNNSDKPEDSPFRGKYDPNKWKKAAEAAAEVITMGQYTLYPDISRLFVMPTNSEIIFQRMWFPSFWMEWSDLPPGVGRDGAGGRNQVTYNMFQLYKILKDGQACDQDDPSSGFDLQNPFVNLDPRFYRDIVYNGANTYRVKNVELWDQGEDGTTGKNNPTQINTFLILRKFCNPRIDASKQTNSWHNTIYIRYAEVLLNYAEAMNEAFGPEVDGLGIGMTARDAVNLIRQRTTYPNLDDYMGYQGGMPDFPAGITKAEFRKEVRQERNVELCFERHLFFDLRRWRVPVESQTKAWFLVPKRNNDKTFTYSLKSQERAFSTSWYLMPIDDSQILISDVEQNPGWPQSPEEEN